MPSDDSPPRAAAAAACLSLLILLVTRYDVGSLVTITVLVLECMDCCLTPPGLQLLLTNPATYWCYCCFSLEATFYDLSGFVNTLSSITTAAFCTPPPAATPPIIYCWEVVGYIKLLFELLQLFLLLALAG